MKIENFDIEEEPRTFALVINGKRFNGFKIISAWEGFAKFERRTEMETQTVIAKTPQSMLPKEMKSKFPFEEIFGSDQVAIITASPSLLESAS